MRAPVEDRRAALRACSEGQLAALLQQVPALAAALDGEGPLAPFGLWGYGVRPTGRPLSLDQFVIMLASPPAIRCTLESLDRFTLQLAGLAVWHGGSLSFEQAVAEAGQEHALALETAAERLGSLLLADRERGVWLALRPGVAELVGLPGVPVRPGLRRVGPEALREVAFWLGESTPPRKHGQLVDLIEARLRDPDVTGKLMERMPADAARIFNLLVQYGPHNMEDLGIAYFSSWTRPRTPVHWLVEHCLAGVDADDQVAWAWLDVVVGLAGGLYLDWSPAPDAEAARPLTAAPAGLPPVLGRLTTLLDAWQADPPPALANGGLGVRPVRAAAKALGYPAGEVGLLAHLAISLGLLGTVQTGTKGRGRNRQAIQIWAPTPLIERWRGKPAAARWAWLVQAWLHDAHLDESDGLPERCEANDWRPDPWGPQARQALLRLLAGLPEGTGFAPDELAEHAAFATPGMLSGPAVPHVVEGARVLGLVSAEGPVGLTALGRAVLQGVEALEAALPPPRREFTLQADQSIIAPPDLAADVGARLERYAELESAAGARIYRLSERRLAAAFDAGERADDVLAFLTEHAVNGVPQNVAYLVQDAARRHGRLRAGSVASYLRSDDPAALSEAVTVKAAKLRLLAPTVAVSSLSRAKLMTALRQKGLMPVAEDGDGATLATPTPQATPVLRAGETLPALRAGLGPAIGDLKERAKQLLEDASAAAGASAFDRDGWR